MHKGKKKICLKDQVLVNFGSLPFSVMLSQFIGEEKIGSNERRFFLYVQYLKNKIKQTTKPSSFCSTNSSRGSLHGQVLVMLLPMLWLLWRSWAFSVQLACALAINRTHHKSTELFTWRRILCTVCAVRRPSVVVRKATQLLTCNSALRCLFRIVGFHISCSFLFCIF